MVDMKTLETKLRDSGYKLTNQRKAIIEVLLENRGHFLSAEDIYIESRKKHPYTNFSTIYRNLDILESQGIVHNTKVDGNTSVYGLVDEHSHHHHIICKGCGKTEAIDFCPLTETMSKLNCDNFTLTGHKFELYGYCKECEKKKGKE